MTTEQKIIKPKVGILELAKQLGHVSQACTIRGDSRDSFYRCTERYERGGEDARKAISRRQPNLHNRMAPERETAIVAMAIAQPAWGPPRVANALAKEGTVVSPAGVRVVPGYCGAQDTFYVGTLKGVGRIYQQTFIDTYAKVGFAKLYTDTTPITAADRLTDRGLPCVEAHGLPLSRVLTDRGTEYCGVADRHPSALSLAVEPLDHRRTNTKPPQTNGIGERCHQTVLNEVDRVACRKRLYATRERLQADLDVFVQPYNVDRPHHGRWCDGKTPMQTFRDSVALAKEKQIA